MAPTAQPIPAAADVLTRRRSPTPDALIGPGPNREETERLIEIALRVPDHGRLSPWRLVLIAGEAKQRWVEKLLELASQREDAPKTRVSTRSSHAPLVASSFLPRFRSQGPEGGKEARLSAGAVCMNG